MSTESQAATLERAQRVLREQFGHERFRPGQDEAVRRVLLGEDLTIVMPTGGGKSLCYQVPALVRDGLTLVVSPLIALMKDQVEALEARGIPASFVNSTIPAAEQRARLDRATRGLIRILYVAPERLATPAFQRAMEARGPALVAIDEAHCISQWGHDFRPAYLGIKDFLARCEAQGRRPQVIALTGTATVRVRQDIAEQLRIGPDHLLMTGFRRDNLRLIVRRCDRKVERLAQVVEIVGSVQGSGIVYCGTRRDVEDVADALLAQGHDVGAYHAGIPDEDRTRVQDDFIADRVRVMVATNAFGMGIDKADVRFIVHHALPGSLEAYWQEAGRAGRDGRSAWCVLVHGAGDRFLHEFFLDGSNPPREVVLAAWASLSAMGDRVTHPPAVLAKTMGVPEMQLSGAMRLLEQAGLMTRDSRDDDDADRSRRAWLVTGRSLPPGEVKTRLSPVLERSAELRRRGEERLRAMERYAYAHACRHRELLRYFGDDRREGCDACDRCRDWQPRAQPVAVARQAVLKEGAPSRGRAAGVDLEQARTPALRAIADVHGRFGLGVAALILRGSRSKKVLSWRLERSEAYGSLARFSKEQVDGVLAALEREGLIETTAGLRPVVNLTEDGRLRVPAT
jgi:ATP-dependent DNA helicase RecQ